MAHGHRNANLADVEALFSGGSVAGLSDAQLLGRFLDYGDEAAFEAILRSHGPMVLGVCRRRLADPSDVDDAFQATFLILVERAQALRDRDVLGVWLHRVAHRVATRARVDARRRREFEGRGVDGRRGDEPPAPADSAETAERRAVLDEELARLPERYRTPLILCDLEGRTHEQAAAMIRRPVGTVKSRLSRARDRLRESLGRRGLLATTGLAPAGPFPEANHEVPAGLLASTARAAARLAAGRGAAAGAVAALMESARRNQPMNAMKLVAAVLTAAGVVTAAANLDARTATEAREPAALVPGSTGEPVVEEPAKATPATLRGRILDRQDRTPIEGARVRLFRGRSRAILLQGRTVSEPIREIASTTSDADGRYAFPGLEPPRPADPDDPLDYIVFAEIDGRPIESGGLWYPELNREVDVHVGREAVRFTGAVRDSGGRPVAGAIVAAWMLGDRPFTALHASETGPDGRFAIDGLPKGVLETVRIFHPAHPSTTSPIGNPPADTVITLPDGCRITGSVTDGATGSPAAGVVVTAERLGEFDEIRSSTGADGRFSMTLIEDRYTFRVEAGDHVAVAIVDQDCPVGQARVLPPFRLVPGGLITGRVVDASTRKPIAVTERGAPIALGLFGPARPLGKVISPHRAAIVDAEGRFTLRAAPGDNFPYFINLQGDRMGWDTTKQPPVVVKEGETTSYDMLVTRKPTPAEEMKAARDAVAELPAEPKARVDRILGAFRKLARTVDETESWCALMRELVAVGRPAVPRLCEELDRTVEDKAIRRLAFALRAIGDPRAVPALVRAIPRTLLPSASDYGLIVEDPRVAEFMHEHDLNPGKSGGRYFDFGRAYREVIAALRKLTGQEFGDGELMMLSRSEDPGRQAIQRRLFSRQARRWASWWETHGRERVEDPAYLSVGLEPEDDAPARGSSPLKAGARLGDGVIGQVLSPPNEGGGHAVYFYDLDTGAEPRWPDHIPRDEARIDFAALAAWARTTGVDLMCVTRRTPSGATTYALRQFGMEVREIGKSDLRNLDRTLGAGTPPTGREVGDLLVHLDEASRTTVEDANGAFLYTTAEGNRGLIETTDRVTRIADLTGSPTGPPAGVGFHKGVRFNLKSIIP
ncbi:sigma-70 family RNA polymerase sigma factor [Aquisphaera insulae]|uniref:sigma-70 family RNA polymerase sigma factor n=1 Tax=Aquisphaera insulae TaxID=2712864 RepID=UPI0013EC508F|nr:sigma-70 family RNA polymerase sigma factor [Aquisphaera insulae]